MSGIRNFRFPDMSFLPEREKRNGHRRLKNTEEFFFCILSLLWPFFCTAVTTNMWSPRSNNQAEAALPRYASARRVARLKARLVDPTAIGYVAGFVVIPSRKIVTPFASTN
jgi:hypothetical protein